MSNKQRIFRDWTLGTLVYAVVMGFFNDYTELLTIGSFSTLFLAALVMQALTFATLGVKTRISDWYRERTGTPNRIAHGLSIWAIMFFSKFLFLEVVDLVFGEAVEISSFAGIMLIITVTVIVSRVIVLFDQRLAEGAGYPPVAL